MALFNESFTMSEEEYEEEEEEKLIQLAKCAPGDFQ